MEPTHDTLDRIAAYLRGQKVPTRTDDIRGWADHLDQVVKPQLDELAQLKAEKATKKGKA